MLFKRCDYTHTQTFQLTGTEAYFVRAVQKIGNSFFRLRPPRGPYFLVITINLNFDRLHAATGNVPARVRI